VSATLWALIGFVAAFLSARAGAPTTSGWLALLTGPIVLLVVGRRGQLHGRGDWIRAGSLELGTVVVLGIAAIFFATLGGAFGSPAGTSSIQTVGFGMGGTDCDLTTVASTFAPTDPIRAAAEFSPELPTGTTVTIWLSQNGHVLEDSRDGLKLDAPAGCVSGPLSDTPLTVGHYRWDLSSDTGLAISGEFDITR